MSNARDIVLSNTISLNPTGTLDFKGTFSLNGNNNLVQNTANASEDNLNKTTNNEFICGQIETFENQENILKNDFYKEIKNIDHKKTIYLICVFIFVFLIFYLI